MTAKDKSINLVNRFFSINNEKCSNKGCNPFIDRHYAIQCSIVAVDELIESITQISKEESGTTLIDYGQGYWQEVKQELINM